MTTKSTCAVGILVALMWTSSPPGTFAQARQPVAPRPSAPPAGAPRAAAPADVSRQAPAPPTPSSAAVDGPAVKGNEVIARVGDSDLTADEVRTSLALLDARQREAILHDPTLLSQAVRGILANRLVLKEALAKKWDQQPAVMAELARARENLIVESYLQSVAAPPANYPSEADIKSVYDANVSAFMVPRRFRLAQIVISVPKDADKAAEDAARKKVDDVVKKVNQPGADFAALARSVSDDKASAERDGEIGWAAEPDLRMEIRSQVLGLPKAGISEPIQLEDGWHIIKLLDTEASHTRPLTEVRDALVQRLRAERTAAERRAYVAELLKQTPPVVNEMALSRLFGATSDAPAH